MVIFSNWKAKMFPEPTDEEVISESEMVVSEINFYLSFIKNKKSSEVEKRIAIDRLKSKLKWM